MNTFGSDNFSTVDPVVLDYLAEINTTGHAVSYEGDVTTRRAEVEFRRVFGDGTEVLFVPAGTGANILSLKLLLQRPYEAVVTSSVSHIFEEETGAAAANLGVHTFTIPHHHGKISVDDLQKEVALRKELAFHSPQPKVVSIANSTEFGTVYNAHETRAIATFCHDNGLLLHVDGCRLPNAAAALNVSLCALTRDAGVDVLSFGGAKNGLMCAEAVVVFNVPAGDHLAMQKQAMQLVSKMRYISGQFVPYLQDEHWRDNAAHANRLGRQLVDGLQELWAAP